ncbi:MAG: phosphate ABC transporter substrate-binding/OmpA family protein [Nanoarchaeota archaeon]
MKPRGKMRPAAKFAIALIAVVGIFFGIKYFVGSVPTEDKESSANVNVEDGEQIIRIGVVTWGGYAGGQYYNGGFKANREKSRFYKDYKLLVEFVLIDDYQQSRDAFKAGEIDLLWNTADAFPCEAADLPGEPQIVFQADWSRGGDAIVVRKGINSVSDLKGKKIAVAFMTPSHTFLINTLQQGGISYKDVEIVEAPNAMDAAGYFKSGKVDAAVVWSPDDAACVEAVNGSKVLTSTKTATHIIADVFIAKKEFIEKNKKALSNLFEGWMKGAAEINNSKAAHEEAAKILAEGLNQPYDFCYNAIANTRLATYGDNLDFFGLNKNYTGVTGEDLFNKMTDEYSNLGYVSKKMNWRLVHTTDIVEMVNLTGPSNQSETAMTFTAPTQDMYDEKKVSAISTKSASINFASGSYTLSDDAKFIVDKEFVDIAKINTSARIRVIGNTDNTGNYQTNMSLSEKRAQAVVDYLVKEYGFAKNRFIVVGNGPKDAVEDGINGSSENYRRTDFELIPE